MGPKWGEEAYYSTLKGVPHSSSRKRPPLKGGELIRREEGAGFPTKNG